MGAEIKCLLCRTTPDGITIYLQVHFDNRQNWVCTRCLHPLIHGADPRQLMKQVQEFIEENKTE